MDVPVVAAAGLKGYVGNKDRLFRLGQGGERALASEEPDIGIVSAQALGQPAQNATCVRISAISVRITPFLCAVAK